MEQNATLIEDTELGPREWAQDISRTTAPAARSCARRDLTRRARLLAPSGPIRGGGRSTSPQEAAWLAEYVSELLSFPNGKNDDQVDSTSQAAGLPHAVKAAVLGPIIRREIIRRDVARRDVVSRHIRVKNCPERRVHGKRNDGDLGAFI